MGRHHEEPDPPANGPQDATEATDPAGGNPGSYWGKPAPEWPLELFESDMDPDDTNLWDFRTAIRWRKPIHDVPLPREDQP